MDFNNVSLSPMDVKVLGTGCAKCKSLEKLTKEVIEKNGINATVTKGEDIMEIMKYKVETESKKAVEALYPELLKSGKLIFKGVNLDEDNSKADAEKCKASGQSLLVICGDKKVDLTSVGFMNAVNSPEKLKAELKKTIDSML